MSAGELLRQANQLKRSGRLDEAIAQRLGTGIALDNQVIEINPHFAWAYHNLGDALVKQGNLEKTMAGLSQSVDL
ncbi:tetratricopeptide repeat protein [Limnospira platensis]|uniref:tetratricopeptide repeat protein n=1 Tax=Limnospira platensis TaxID=118562 RepID=UPI003D6E752B